jgi:hypothetical protein
LQSFPQTSDVGFGTELSTTKLAEEWRVTRVALEKTAQLTRCNFEPRSRFGKRQYGYHDDSSGFSGRLKVATSDRSRRLFSSLARRLLSFFLQADAALIDSV